MDLKNKKVTVIGLGNSGYNAAMLLADHGALVRVTDVGKSESAQRYACLLRERNMAVELGCHSEDYIRGSELVVLSPGVEDSSPAMRWAMQHNIPVIGEMELGYQYCKGKIIAITGTNGKSTVTMLIGAILKDAGFDTVVCGNIGNSLCGEIKRIGERTWVVLEVSSFQLEKIRSFKPHIAVILNITDDHMDRYKTFSEYYKEKLKVFLNQDENDVLVLNYDAENLRALKDRVSAKVYLYSRLKKVDGAYLDGDVIVCRTGPDEERICKSGDSTLRGLHNVENMLVASMVGVLAGARAGSIKRTIGNFKGLAHRFETVAMIDGVEYIDDSKGTTVDSTKRALESCARPVILIAGGKDKHSDYALIRGAITKHAKAVILIGEARPAIRAAIDGIVPICDASDMDEAVRAARDAATKGDMVLLSPMCSSFDMYSSYKERGEAFKRAVNDLDKKAIKGSA